MISYNMTQLENNFMLSLPSYSYVETLYQLLTKEALNSS